MIILCHVAERYNLKLYIKHRYVRIFKCCYISILMHFTHAIERESFSSIKSHVLKNQQVSCQFLFSIVARMTTQTKPYSKLEGSLQSQRNHLAMF